MNKLGSYECTCASGFSLLQSNNQSCLATGANDPLLLYATTSTINWLTLRKKHKNKVTFAENPEQIEGISYDGDNIYWMDNGFGKSLLRAKIDGADIEV